MADARSRPAAVRGRPPIHTDAEILDVALEAFAVAGYEGVSVRSISQSLGLSHGAINQRFGSKDELFRAAVDHGFGGIFDEVGRRLAALPPPRSDLESLRNMVHAFLEAVWARPELVRLLNLEGVTSTDRLDHIATTHVIPNVGPSAAALRRLAAAGEIRPLTVRDLFFLVALGAAAPYTLTALSAHFDGLDGPLDPAEHARTITDVIIAGLRLNPARRS